MYNKSSKIATNWGYIVDISVYGEWIMILCTDRAY